MSAPVSVRTLPVRFYAGMSGIEQDARVASNQHSLLFPSSSGEEEEEEEEEEEDGGPTEEEWCAKMQTFLLSSRAPPSLGSLLNPEKLNPELSYDDKLLMPGPSSALSPAASNAAPAAHRSIPLLVQQGTSSHSHSLKQSLDTRLLPPLLPTFAAGPKADSDHGHAQRLDSRLHKLTDTQATLMSSLGKFSKVISKVTFHRKYTRVLTFENLFQAPHSVT